MTITLLLDLDDTLLDTNMDAFLPVYIKHLSGALASVVPPDKMVPALMEGTQAMLRNSDPALTLQQVFDAIFFPRLGTERASLQPVIDRFYEEVFATLGYMTKPIPEAIRLVEWAFEQGYRVAIATNPIFPLKAVQHRMRWAGLPPEKYPFALVSSYETFHFTKEMVAYYPEFLAQLGWPEDPVVMVGDDVEREAKPTQAAGLPVYLVQKTGKQAGLPPEVPQGSLEDLRAWLVKTDPGMLKVSLETPSAMLACLRATSAAFATLTAHLSPQDWLRSPAAGEWCLTEILCHLRDVEREVNLPRLRKVSEEENPFIPGEDSDRWAAERQYTKQDGPRALVDFLAARKETLELLSGLQAEWSRRTRHAIFGPTTLKELVGFMADHDRLHVQQSWKTLPDGRQGK